MSAHSTPSPTEPRGSVVTEREEARAEVREREIEETAENERERFGMDLHDGLGQSLTGVAFLAKALYCRLADEGDRHADEVGTLVELVEDAVGEARQMARGLNPVDASPEGLGDALQSLADTIDATYPSLRCVARVESMGFEDRREARHLFRIAQEALNNAAKHAGASEVVVTLAEEGTDVILVIQDDGQGVPEELLRVAPARATKGAYPETTAWRPRRRWNPRKQGPSSRGGGWDSTACGSAPS